MRWELTAGNIRRSWTGGGSLEITGPGDPFEVRDYVIVFIYVAVVDLIAFFLAHPFLHGPNPACGPNSCYVDPHATVHNAWLYVWLTAVVAVVTIAVTAFWKTGRVVVAVFQGAIFAGVVIVAVTAVIRAQGQLQELSVCHLGVDGPCIGVDRAS